MSPTNKYDQLLMEMAGGCGSLEGVLDEFFSFLHRKTDFFVEADAELFAKKQARMGFPPGQAEKLLLSSFRKFPKKRLGGVANAGGGAGANAAANVGANAGVPLPVKAKDSDPPLNTTTTTANPTSASNPPELPPLPPLNDKGEQIPAGNGGVTDQYYWTQSLYETTVYISIPPSTSSRDLDCAIKANSVSLKYKDSSIPPILIGDFPKTVKPGESLWSLDKESSTLVLTLDKVQRTWWDCAIVGDTKIDTSKVRGGGGYFLGSYVITDHSLSLLTPALIAQVDSTMKVDEYDAATQGAIRKIMFDQKQQRLGLPTSDDILGVSSGMSNLNIPPPPSGM